VADKPNILWIMTDQQRADSLGYARPGPSDTPRLDSLARQGVIFDTAYSSSPSCVPARSSLMTGILHHRLPLMSPGPRARTPTALALKEGYWTIARALRNHSYDTALFGKMHFQPIKADHGFDTIASCEHLPAGYPADTSDDYRQWLEAEGLQDVRFHNPTKPCLFPYDDDRHPTEWITGMAEKFLNMTDRDKKPWFTVVSYPDPHTPYLPLEKYARQCPPENEKLPPEGIEVNNSLPGLLKESAMRNDPGGFFTPRRVESFPEQYTQAVLAAIRANIRHIDDVVQRLLDCIDLDNTIVVFLSDHGDFGGHRGFLGKAPWLPFDDLVRVPFFWAGAGINSGKRYSAPVQSFDLAPTLLDFAGIPLPCDNMDGISLRQVLQGGTMDVERTVVSATTEGAPMIRQGRYKHIWHSGEGSSALYDLQNDPGERNNLADDPQFASLISDNVDYLRRLLDSPTPDLWQTDDQQAPEYTSGRNVFL